MPVDRTGVLSAPGKGALWERYLSYIKSVFRVGAVEKSEGFGEEKLVLVCHFNSYAFHLAHVSETFITISCWYLTASKTPFPEVIKQADSLLYLQSAWPLTSSYKAFCSRCWPGQVRPNTVILTRDATICALNEGRQLSRCRRRSLLPHMVSLCPCVTQNNNRFRKSCYSVILIAHWVSWTPFQSVPKTQTIQPWVKLL